MDSLNLLLNESLRSGNVSLGKKVLALSERQKVEKNQRHWSERCEREI